MDRSRMRIVLAAMIFAAMAAISGFAQSQSSTTSSASPTSGPNDTPGANSQAANGQHGKWSQKDSSPSQPAPRTADGKPDFSGTWAGGGGDINKDLPGQTLPYTPAGLAAYQDNLTKAPDPQSLCILVGQPRADTDAYPFEIVQSPTRIAFLYERDSSWRLVPIDGRQHPDDPEPTFFGDSVGRWEGDALVVDVVALKGEKVWSDNDAHPHSDALHLVEKWTRPDLDHLVLSLTIDDPKYYSHPFTYTRRLKLQKFEPAEFACDENNIDRDHLGPGLGTKSGHRGYDPLPTK